MYYFIVNPKAGSHRGIQIWNRLVPILSEKKIDYKLYLTTHAGHATDIAKRMTGERTIIVLGGDGTINEVINGLEATASITLGYIPAGSSNDFARSLHLARDPAAAFATIQQGKTRLLDYGILSDAKGNQKRFLVSCGIGFDAAVCQEALDSRLKGVLNKLRLGKLTYLSIALKQLMKMKGTRGTLTTQDGKILPMRNLIFTSVHIHPYEGGGFLFCPEADPTDGILDFCMADDLSKLKSIMTLPKALKGNHTRVEGITVSSCESLCIEVEQPCPVHMDGEFFGIANKIEVRLSQEQIAVIL